MSGRWKAQKWGLCRGSEEPAKPGEGAGRARRLWPLEVPRGGLRPGPWPAAGVVRDFTGQGRPSPPLASGIAPPPSAPRPGGETLVRPSRRAVGGSAWGCSPARPGPACWARGSEHPHSHELRPAGSFWLLGSDSETIHQRLKRYKAEVSFLYFRSVLFLFIFNSNLSFLLGGSKRNPRPLYYI